MNSASKPANDSAATFKSTPELTVAAIARMAIGMLFTMLAIKALGATAWGQYSVVFSVGLMFLFAYGGFYSIIVSELVEARAKPREEGDAVISSLVSGSIGLTIPGVCAMALLGFGLSKISVFDAALEPVILASTLMICSQMICDLAIALLEGMGSVRMAAFLPLLAPGLAMIALCFWVAIGQSVTLDQFLVLMVVTFILETVVAVLIAAFRLSSRWSWNFEKAVFKTLINNGFKLQTSRLVAMSSDPINKLALNYFVGPASVAVYDFANKLANGLQGIFAAYSRLFLQIPRDASDFRNESVRRAADNSWAMYLFAASLVAIVIVGPASSWLKLNAAELAACFAICAMAHWFMTLATPMFLGLISFGSYRFIFRNQLILTACCSIGALVLVPVMGTTGVFMGLLFATLINVWMIEQHFAGLVSKYESLWRVARPMLPRLIVGLALMLIPTLLIPHLSRSTGYWSAIAVCLLTVAIMIAREPIWSSLGSLWRGRFPRPQAFGVDDVR